MSKRNLKFIITIVAFIASLNLPGFADLPFWRNIKVNYNLEPTSEEETTIAVYGNYIVVGYHYVEEDDTTSTTQVKNAVAYSHDGGKTWHCSLMPLPSGFTDACDPCVAVSDDGTFYYAQLGIFMGGGGKNQVYISRSDDYGVTWTTPADIDNGDLDTESQDKEWIAVDGDNVYITFYSNADIVFVRSTDKGVTFDTHQELNDSGTCNGSIPIFDGNNVYVFWKNFSDNKFYMARSTDGGATFEANDIQVADTHSMDYPGFRLTAQFPVVVVNPVNHNLYCVWMDGQGAGDPSDIYFTSSDDSGDTWSTSVRVNDDATGNGQWYPWMDIDSSGICHIVWYDERNNTDSLGENLDLYYATYDESTGTFSSNVRVTDQSFEVVLPPEPGIVSFIGDYIGVAHENYAHALWMDSRGGTQDVFTSEYTEQLPQKVQAIMVNDVSGSMSWDSSVPGIIKIEAVKEDAELILDLLRDGSGSDPQDKLGMVQFASSTRDFSDDDPPVRPTVSYISLTPVDSGFRTKCRDYVEEMYGSGGTSIAIGLQKAIDDFVANPAVDAQNMIVLLSDGHETADPRVDQDLINNLRFNNIQCFTLGYGTDPYIDEPLLFDIAAQTGGIYHYADSDSPAVIQNLYIKVLAAVLGGTPIVDPIYQVSPGSPPIEEKAKITEADRIAYFILGWIHPEVANKMNLSLKTPGPNPVTINKSNVGNYSEISYIAGDTYICYKVRFPLSGNLSSYGPGEWTMIASGEGPGGGAEEINLVSFVQSDLKMEAYFTKYKYGSGDSITIRAELTQKDIPIKGANVYLDANLPLQSLGNFLSLTKMTSAQKAYMKRLLEERPDMNLKAAKLKTLLETSEKDFFPRKTKTSLSLYDDGLHNDLAANDGIYADTFTWTETPGTYSFLVTAECTSLGGNEAVRQQHPSLYEKVAIDSMKSLASVIPFDYPDLPSGKTSYQVIITPKDRFGNYLGPGFPQLIKLSSTMGHFKKVIDNNDGTYSSVLVADANRKIRITVNVDGVKLKTQPVAPPEKPEITGFSLHIGGAIPLGNFSNDYKAGFNIVGDFEYKLTSGFSLRAYLGYNQFRAKPNIVDDTYIINVNADLRYSVPMGSIIVFAEVGPGYYIIENNPNKAGLNVGCGIWYGFSSKLGLELVAHYHSIFTSPDKTYFLHLAGGLTFNF